MTGARADDEGAPAVGPLALEAALLLDVVADRLAALRPDATGVAPTPQPPRTDGRPGPGRPPGPDEACPECGAVPGASCTACPLCRLLAVLRGERPESTAKLVDGALLIVRTLRSMIPDIPAADPAATAGEGAAAGHGAGDEPAPPRRGGLERIDIL